MNQRTHLLHIITGDGKGKTTAAMGQAVRMLGHGKKVYIAQFMKDGTSGELSVLRGLPGVFVSKGARMQGFLNSRNAQQMEDTRLAHEEALKDIIKEIKRHSYYLKPGEKKRVKAALARKRNRKKRPRDFE